MWCSLPFVSLVGVRGEEEAHEKSVPKAELLSSSYRKS